MTVQGVAWQLSGTCALSANVTFAGSATLTSMPATVAVVAAQATNVYVLPADALALPSVDSEAMAPYLQPRSAPLLLLKCDWRNYEAVSVCELVC